MMGTFRVLPAPDLAGLSVDTASSAWGYGSWVEIIQTSEECSILGVSFMFTLSAPAVDSTQEVIFDIGTGAAGAESVKVQITASTRSDTAVGYIPRTLAPFLPEPFTVTAGQRIAVRAASHVASVRTYQGFRLLIDQITPAGPQRVGIRVNQAVNRAAVI